MFNNVAYNERKPAICPVYETLSGFGYMGIVCVLDVTPPIYSSLTHQKKHPCHFLCPPYSQNGNYVSLWSLCFNLGTEYPEWIICIYMETLSTEIVSTSLIVSKVYFAWFHVFCLFRINLNYCAKNIFYHSGMILVYAKNRPLLYTFVHLQLHWFTANYKLVYIILEHTNIIPLIYISFLVNLIACNSITYKNINTFFYCGSIVVLYVVFPQGTAIQYI